MKLAIAEARSGSQKKHGGPFGALIVHEGRVVAKAHNEVLKTNDPTAHAEIVAIRKASYSLGRFHLSDCSLYTTCEPCPMCLAAILWARIPTVYYGATRIDAKNIGFDDALFYEFLTEMNNITPKNLPCHLVQHDPEECVAVFKEWAKSKKTIY